MQRELLNQLYDRFLFPEKGRYVDLGEWSRGQALDRDLLREAVEVSKLSLLLKVLEGETAQTLRQFGLFGERALPSLEENIKCGNSLIEHADVKELFTDEEEKTRINAFDWKEEFPEVFGDGGFDVVVGNPPYIRIQMMQEWAPREVELYKTLYLSNAPVSTASFERSPHISPSLSRYSSYFQKRIRPTPASSLGRGEVRVS